VVSQHGPVDLITCTNTLNHIDDLRSFFSGLARCLAPQGSVVIEVPSVLAFLRETQFDTLYHEHLSVFGITALDALAARVGLAVTRVTPLDLHGGSLRIVLEREGAAIDPAVNTTRDREAREGATVSETLDSFSQRVATIREAVVRHLTEARDSGRRVAGYCAPAKATTLLNAFQIDPTLLPYVVDNSPLKQGRLIPGCRIPIVSAAVLQEQPPEELLILAWNLAREIQRKEADFARAGGRFLVPVPELRVLA
jgi:SAM-dependent methyltransferase